MLIQATRFVGYFRF